MKKTLLTTAVIATTAITIISGAKGQIINAVKDALITDEKTNSIVTESLDFLNEQAMQSLATIDEVTGDNMTEKTLDLVDQANNEFANKMEQIENGTYDADKEFANLQQQGKDAFNYINDETNLLTDEEIDELKNEFNTIKNEKFEQVENGEFNADEELEKLKQQGQESWDYINGEAQNSYDELNKETDCDSIVEQIKNNEVVKNIIEKVKTIF